MTEIEPIATYIAISAKQLLSSGNELLLAAVQRLWDICCETHMVSGLDEDSVYSEIPRMRPRQ